MQKKVQLEKLVAVTADGTPAMINRQTGFITHCKADPDFPKCLHYCCVIHQQALCAEVIGSGHIMTLILKIVNNLSCKAKQHRIFKVLLEEMSVEYGEYEHCESELAFLTDITGKLNHLICELQDNGKTIFF